MNNRDKDEFGPLTCEHPRHLLMIGFWVGWNPDRDGGRWETCDVPRPVSEDQSRNKDAGP